MRRTEVSRPVRLALSDGLLAGGQTFLDYGCGHGGDVRRLVRLGFDASGWDPAHPSGEKREAAVVNLGYVVNVVEDPAERLATLQDAWRLTKEVLVVAARLDTDHREMSGAPLGDGVLTRIGTFQKYFSQDELLHWLSDSIEEQPVAAAPGVFYLFRDPARREAFAASHFRSRVAGFSLSKSIASYRENKMALTALADFFDKHGRLPATGELSAEEMLKAAFGSVRRAFTFLRTITGPERWDLVRRIRSADLLVYLALARLRGRPRLSLLPPGLRRDIRSLFSTYRFACAAADTLLFRAGRAEAVDAACRSSAVGKLTSSALYVHESALASLSPVLRVYEGCARTHVGSVEGANVIKLYRRESRVSYLAYPDFDTDPHPVLSQSTTTRLRSLEIRVRRYEQSANPPILHRKELFVLPSYVHHRKFARLTCQEEEHGLYAGSPSIGYAEQWRAALADRRLGYLDHELVSIYSTHGPDTDPGSTTACG